MSSRTVLLTLLVAAASVGCRSVAEADQPRETLDERTGSTLTVVDKPLVFARDRSERAANLRDYLTLVAASVNQAGKVKYVLVSYAWSTLDPRFGATNTNDVLILTADDRRMVLKPLSADPVEAGVGTPLQAPPGVQTISRVYASDLGTMRFIAAARSLRVQVSADADAPYYELWDDERASLASFVDHLENPTLK